MKIAAIVNGISKGQAACVEALRQQDVDIKIRVTKAVGDAKELALSLAQDGTDFILCCGGDGTLNECINGIVDSGNSQCAVGLYPIGSANDYARILPKRSLSALLEAAVARSHHRHDIVMLSFNNKQKYFGNISACGIGAEIAATVNERRFKLNPILNYYSGIVSWLMKYKAPLLSIRTDSETLEYRCFLAAIGKGKFAGNGLGLLPQTHLNDGMLGLSIIGDVNVIDFLRYQGRLKKGERIIDNRVHYYSCDFVEIEVLQGTLALETDGEYYARLKAGHKVIFVVLPKAIAFVY